MTDVHFEDVLKLAEQLPEHEQYQLIYALRLKQVTRQLSASDLSVTQDAEYRSYTREELLADVEALRQIPPRAKDSLFGKYANSNVPEMTAEEFHAQMHAIASQWEQELDEYPNNQS